MRKVNWKQWISEYRWKRKWNPKKWTNPKYISWRIKQPNHWWHKY